MAHYDCNVSLSADVTFFIKGCFQVNTLSYTRRRPVAVHLRDGGKEHLVPGF